MSIAWQDAATWTLVGVAILYLLVRLYRAVRSKWAGGCTACPHCQAPPPPLVTLDPPKRDQP